MHWGRYDARSPSLYCSNGYGISSHTIRAVESGRASIRLLVDYQVEGINPLVPSDIKMKDAPDIWNKSSFCV